MEYHVTSLAYAIQDLSLSYQKHETLVSALLEKLESIENPKVKKVFNLVKSEQAKYELQLSGPIDIEHITLSISELEEAESDTKSHLYFMFQQSEKIKDTQFENAIKELKEEHSDKIEIFEGYTDWLINVEDSE